MSALDAVIVASIEDGSSLGGEIQQFACHLESYWRRLVRVTQAMSRPERAVLLSNSHLYLEAFGHIVIGWVWLEQYMATQGRTEDFYAGKRHAARYFFRHELPKVAVQLDLLGTLDQTTLDMCPQWF